MLVTAEAVKGECRQSGLDAQEQGVVGFAYHPADFGDRDNGDFVDCDLRNLAESIALGRLDFDLIHELRGKYTVVIVTHNMQQAARVSDYTAFMYLGRLIEYGPTGNIFQNPRLKQTEDYITGRFG